MNFYRRWRPVGFSLTVLLGLWVTNALAVDIGITNGDFEIDADDTAPPTGWVDNSAATSFWTGALDNPGNPTTAEGALAPSPGLGNVFLTTARTSAGAGSQPTDGQLVQIVDLSSFSTAIDTGDQFLFVDFIWASDDERDTGTFSLNFFDTTDGSGTPLGSGFNTSLDADDGFNFVGWFEESVGGAVPVNTRSVALQIDTTRTGGSETNLWFDNFVGDITDTPVLTNEWNVNGGGSFNVAANWLTSEVPTADAIFGNVLTDDNAPATVTLDSAVSLNSVSFQSANQYILAGTETLTLTGDAEVAAAGTHVISAEIAGSAGLVKTGSGVVVLNASNSFTGTTDVQVGALALANLDAIDNQASGVVNVEAAGTVLIGAGASGTLNAQLTGGGLVNLDDTFDPAESVTLTNNNSGFTGLIRVDSGTLVVANNDALGAGVTPASRTTLDDDSTARISLPGGITIANEVLDMDGRSTDAVGLTSAGSNSWNGVIDGQGSSGAVPFFNIESTSGLLTLSELYASDVEGEAQTFVFSGSGDTRITTRLSEDSFDDVSGGVVPSVADNVGVIKRGSGNLTVAIGTDGGRIDYWFGPTDIAEGSLTVTDPISTDQGELRSSDILIREGATLDVSAFSVYSQQTAELGVAGRGQAIRGSGEIVANTVALFDDGYLAPGDTPGGAGTLNLSGNATMNVGDTGGVWSFDIGNDSDASGDLLAVTGTFQTNGSPSFTVNVTPANGHLDAGGRAIVTHSGGTNTGLNGLSAQITDPDGNVLNARQTVSISGSTAGEIQVLVQNEEATRTWDGDVSGAWDVATSNNWQEGDQRFQDLDRVTFDDFASGTTEITVDGPRFAGATTFNNSAKTYTFTGQGGLVGTGSVEVNSGTVQFQNTGNNYSGTTTVASGARLEMDTATTGDIVVNGTLAVGGALTPEPEFTYVDADRATNTGPAGAFTPGVNDQADDNLWTERTGLSSGGTIYQSGDGDGEDAPELMTTISGLAPNSEFTVYVHFWDADPDGPWVVQGGLTSGDTTLFADPEEVGAEAGSTAAVLASSLAYSVAPTVLVESNRTMFAGLLGQGMSDGSGNLTVFIDDKALNNGAGNRTWYDGVSVSSGLTGGFINGQTLTVNGDFLLDEVGTLELQLGAAAFDSLDISGTATLDGMIDVSLLGTILPEDGAVFTVLSADGGIETALGSLDFGSGLPSGFSAAYNEAMTELILTYTAVTGLLGDSNGDGVVNTLDIDSFVLALTNPAQYAIDFPDVPFLVNNDIDMNGVVNTLDIDPFVALLTGGSTAAPEPTASLLAAMAFTCWGLRVGRSRRCL